MTAKEILKEAFDSDIEVMNKCFKADLELAELLRKEIATIWVALLEKGLVTEEDIKEITGQIEKHIASKEVGKEK